MTESHTLMEINTLRELKELYSDPDTGQKWILLSTGGFHGTNLTLDEVESILRGESPISDPVNGKYWISFYMVYPEADYLPRYGNISIDLGDIQWLREVVRESLTDIHLSQEGNI